MTLAEEIKAMLTKARQYLASAALLHQAGDFDSAVSRLYYAKHDGAGALLLSRGQTFSSHRAVLTAFGREFVKSGLFSKDTGCLGLLKSARSTIMII